MLTDGQWAALAPLNETSRPPSKVAPQNLRQTTCAIRGVIRMGRSGGRCRRCQGRDGEPPQTFIRWSRLGVWKRLLTLVQQDQVKPGMTF